MKNSMKENQYRFCGKSAGRFANNVKVPAGPKTCTLQLPLSAVLHNLPLAISLALIK
jgi:hypothetical protein